MKPDCTRCAKAFKAMGDTNRLHIVKYLRQCGKEIGASELLVQLSVAQPTLAHHMKILTQAGLVFARKDGRPTYYSLNVEEFLRIGECLSSIAQTVSA